MALLLQLKQKLVQGFQGFWARYPNRTAKKDAEKAWGQVVKSPAIEEEIHAALDWQIPHWQTMEWYHPPYPATYLRKERFRDEPPTTTRNRGTAPAKTLVPMAVQQQEASQKIKLLVESGMDRDEAKQQVYRQMGWIQ